MDKNKIFFAVLAALVMPVVISCGTPRLKIYNWTYYTPDSVIRKFEKEYNVKVIYDEFASNEEMFAKLKVRRGRSYDIVFPSGDYVAIMIRENMLERIDRSKMSNLGNIDPEILKKAVYDPNMDYAVPYFYGAAGIIVNTARVPDFERSWSIFGREDLQGRMTMLDDMREVIGGALTFLGHSVNSIEPAQITAARDLINTMWKPNLVKFDAESFGLAYANGDFWVVHGFAEGVFEEIAGDAQLMQDTVFFIPQEGGPAYIDNMCILKGSKNIDLAHKFIDFIHRPDIYAEFVSTFNVPPSVNIPARRLVTVDTLYTVEELINTELVVDVGPAFDLYTDAWFNSIRIDK